MIIHPTALTFKRRGEIARFCSQVCQTDFIRLDRASAYKGGKYVCQESGDVIVLVHGKDAREGIGGLYRALKRVVAEKHIGRKLLFTECVIHLDGDKLNNEPENLYICGIGLTRSLFRYKTKAMPKGSNLETYQ